MHIICTKDGLATVQLPGSVNGMKISEPPIVVFSVKPVLHLRSTLPGYFRLVVNLCC
jgi:hypothetical protein